MTVLPATLDHDGQQFLVRRAWPDRDRTDRDRIAVELVDPQSRIRGGHWSPSGAALFDSGLDPALPTLGEVTGAVVSHRPGKRVVLRAGDHWVKVVRPGRERRILAATDQAAGFADTFRLPTVVDHRTGLVVFSHLAGRSMADGHGWSTTDWAQAWAQILLAWVGAGAASHQDPTDGQLHDAAAEAAVLHRWVATAPRELLPYEMGERVDRAVDALLGGQRSPIRISHRDLHDQQLVWDREHGPGLLDLDTVTMAEAALDLGNLRAHSQWRVLQGHWTAGQAEVVQDLIDRTAARAGITPQRLSVWEEVALLRLVCVHLHRPADRTHVAALLRPRSPLCGASPSR